MPALGLGTWQLTGRACQRTVELALELGYRHIDTAQGYHNEADIGRALRQSKLPRSDCFITSKVWPDHLVEAPACVHQSLERLGLDQLDLLLLHWPSPTLPLEVTIQALYRCLEQGVARHIGVSNFPVRLLTLARSLAPIACNQIELHPFLDQGALLAACRQQGVAVTAYSPLARGETSKAALLQRLAARRGRSVAQVTLRWLLQRGVCVIPKASSKRHLIANLAALDFELSADEVEELDAMNRGQRRRLCDPNFAPNWDD